MLGRTYNSFTRPLPYCPTSTCGLLEINCAAHIYRVIRALFPDSTCTASRITAPPESAIRRYIASPRTEPVTVAFLRAAVAALHAQPAPVRQSPQLLGVLSRLPVPNRLQPVFLGGQRSTACPASDHTPPTPTADTGQGRNLTESPRVSVFALRTVNSRACG